eukprot:15455955-Alexandrium_andersonii.AAC.1
MSGGYAERGYTADSGEWSFQRACGERQGAVESLRKLRTAPESLASSTEPLGSLERACGELARELLR